MSSHPAGHQPDRPVDAIADRYVEEAAALDPVMATYAGIAGHDHRLPDLSPDGFAAREELDREGAGRRPRRAARRRARAGRARGVRRAARRWRSRWPTPGSRAAEVSVIASGLHEIRGAFDLMPTEGEEALAQHRRPARRPSRAPSPATARPCSRPPTRAASSAAPAVRRGGRPGPPLDRPGGRAAATCSRSLVAVAGAEGCAGRRPRRGTPPRPARRSPSSAASSSDELAPRGRDREAVGREEYALCSRYFLGADGRPRRDLRLGLGGAQAARRRDGRDRRPRSCPAAPSTRPSPPSTPTPPDASTGAERVPRLDAGARRPHGRRAGRRALRHPRADPPHRVLPRPDQRRRHLLHRPQRGLQPARPDVVVGARRHRRRSPPGARSPPSSTRACPATTSRCAQTAYRADAAQPLAAADVLGQRPRRGLGAVRRAADGRPRLPRRPGRQARHARRPGVPGGPGDHRHRHAPGAGDPADNPFGFHPGETWTPELGLEFMRQHCRMDDDVHRSSRSTATSAGRARRRRTRSASASGCEARDEVKARRGRRLRPQGSSTARRSTSARSGSTRSRQALARL